MKNLWIIKNIFMNIATAIEESESKTAFFKQFKAVPETYFDDTSRNGAHSAIRSQIMHGHVIRTKYGSIAVVTECMVDGCVHYMERSLFHTGTTDITEDVKDVIYSGSVPNCWYKWYQLTQVK